jgi:DNA-binding winged helix-turn-helix (wHTH) protein/pimeloyl-ACP methyl ester carboxylesterase
VEYTIGEFVLDPESFDLTRSGETVAIEPQVFEVIVHLVKNRDRLVSKNELLDEVWGDRFVSESTLTTRIRAARSVLGDDGKRQELIRTVHARGYRFVGPVETSGDAAAVVAEPDAAMADPPPQQIQFCTSSDGVRLAYATMGTGPPLVRAAHWITHLDYDWHSPVWRHWLAGLSARNTLVRYDERGCGLSDHDAEDFSFDALVRDLETVVDAMGIERFPLLGVSQGGSVAVAYAARNPGRVSHLVLLNSYLEGRRIRGDDDDLPLQIEITLKGWGSDNPGFRQFFVSQFIPDHPEMWSDFSELLRRTTPARNAAALMSSWAEIDVTEDAAALDIPTLVLHCTGDMRVPFEQARLTASLIAGARLVPLDNRNHLFHPDDASWQQVLDEIHTFLEAA